MVSGLALCPDPKRALVVGLGGGTIPNFLHKHYPQTQIDAVDIDPVVIEVAKQFFGFREDATLKAYVQDGRQFIEERLNVYDVIFLDAFSSEDIPYHLATREFLEAVRRAVTARGVVLANVWGSGLSPLYDSMVRTYQEVFDELYILDVWGSGNKILVALPRRLRVAREELAQRAGEISKQKQFRFDMAELVTYGYQYADEKDPRVQVLIDKK
jgi:spermidine synthase